MTRKLFSSWGSQPEENAVVEESRVPQKDDSVECWQAFAEKVGWREVYDVHRSFVPRAYGPYADHDMAVCNLLSERLFRMEQPILSPAFLGSLSADIIEVENGADNEAVKAVVSSKSVSVPMYVVERCGKLRGFALAPQLILAGVTATAFRPYWVLKMAEKMNVSLLSREETEVVEKNLQRLLGMMSKVGVPRLHEKEWMLLPSEDDVRAGSYETYNLRHSKRLGYLEHDDFSVLVAKL